MKLRKHVDDEVDILARRFKVYGIERNPESLEEWFESEFEMLSDDVLTE